MKIEDGRLRRGVEMILRAGWDERPDIGAIRDWLKGEGVIEIDVNTQEIEQARDILRYARRMAEKDGDIGRLPFALTKLDDETGERVDYWVHNDEMTPEESAKHTARLDRKIGRACKQRSALHAYRTKQHGEAYTQALFHFKNPAPAAP